jgi:transposase
MSYRIAGIDVHKKMLAVVVADVAIAGEYRFERSRYGSNPEHLRYLAEKLIQEQVEEVVMESTAQYWKPVWGVLERYWKPVCQKREGAGPHSGTLHLAQAQSNRGPRGRKRDFPDAERLVKRLVAQELTLSFVPDTEQRVWRALMRRKYQLTRHRVQLQNRLEALLEEAHIKLSSLVSDLLGVSARRMLKALAEGETDPAILAALADPNLRATTEQLCDALGACRELQPVYRRLLQMFLEELQLIDQQINRLGLRMRRMWRLPFGERWPLEIPALSSSPGHAPTQEESCCGESKVAALAPTSAMICCAELTPRPGTAARRWTASWCWLS